MSLNRKIEKYFTLGPLLAHLRPQFDDWLTERKLRNSGEVTENNRQHLSRLHENFKTWMAWLTVQSPFKQTCWEQLAPTLMEFNHRPNRTPTSTSTSDPSLFITLSKEHDTPARKKLIAASLFQWIKLFQSRSITTRFTRYSPPTLATTEHPFVNLVSYYCS